MGLFSFLFSILNSTAAFVYPTYASYKSLSRRPASDQELERWLMYWSVVGCVMAVEYVAEWSIRWIPLYGLIKTCFLLWLALPQTQGATYVYRAHLAPFLTKHQPTIDSYLSQYKIKLYKYLQDQFRSVWKHISALIAEHTGINLNAVDPQASPRTEAAQGLAGSGRDPNNIGALGQGAKLALGLWTTWGPTVMNALQPIKEQQERDRERERQAEASGSSLHVAGASQPTPAPSGLADTTSILARRRQLEAELATLNALHPNSSVMGSPNLPTIPTPSTASTGASSDHHPSPSLGNLSLGQSQYLSEPETRTLRDRDGKYEEIDHEDIQGSEDGREGGPASPASSTWWPAWGRRTSGYERVKTD